MGECTHTVFDSLNRIEYENTMSDLLGMEVHVKELLPPDDSGYGFDNIGDVLTLSPLHLERFLEAARLFQPDGCRPGDGRERDEQLEERHVVQARHRATREWTNEKFYPKCKFRVLSKRRIRHAGAALGLQ